MHRRLFLTALAAALPTSAWAAQKEPVKLARAFPFLDFYWKLPPAERSRFSLTFSYRLDDHPATDLRAWIIEGSARTPVTFSRDGRVAHPPTLAQLNSSAMIQFDVPAEATLKPSPELHAVAPLATQLDAHDLQASIAQAASGVKKMAGIMAFKAPNIAVAQFPGADSGKAALPDGRAFALAPGKFGPLYDPAKEPGAKTIILAKAPSRILLTPSA